MSHRSCSVSVFQILQQHLFQSRIQKLLLTIHPSHASLALKGHVAAAAEAEGQVFTFPALLLPLPVVRAVLLLPALCHAMPDISAGKLRVAYQGDALVNGAVVVHGKGIIDIHHAGCGLQFREVIAPLHDRLPQHERGRMHPGLVVGAAAPGELRIGKTVVDLHHREKLNAIKVGGRKTGRSQGVEQGGKGGVVLQGIIAAQGDGAEPPTGLEIGDDGIPTPLPVFEWTKAVVVVGWAVDGDFGVYKPQRHEFFDHRWGEE